MSVSFKIDFDELYDVEVSPDITFGSFTTDLEKGGKVLLNLKISKLPHALMPNVYNLSFGPLNTKGKIDDKAELRHTDYSKVFSTILFTGVNYLKQNPDHFLGIDGSDNARAYYYYRAIQRNFAFLDKHFLMIGIKYYVRISRFRSTQFENPFDFDDVMAYPTKIEKGAQISQDDMYNYFIFNMKQ